MLLEAGTGCRDPSGLVLGPADAPAPCRRTGLDVGCSPAVKALVDQLDPEKSILPSEAPEHQSQMPLPFIFLSWEVQGCAAGAESQDLQTQGGSFPSSEPGCIGKEESCSIQVPLSRRLKAAFLARFLWPQGHWLPKLLAASSFTKSGFHTHTRGRQSRFLVDYFADERMRLRTVAGLGLESEL